jgi:hypothetical protein
MPEQEIKKPKKRYFSAIFWLALIIFAYFSLRYFWSEFNYDQAKDSAKSQFANIETEIYQTPLSSAEIAKPDDKPLTQNEILLKQQLQISELQNSFNALKADLARFKLNDSLPKIILSFVKLQDLVLAKQNYNSELQKLEALSRADFALTGKIEKLKLALESKAKNSEELTKEFADLIPNIKAKQIEIESNGSWFGKVKATIARFIVIKRTDENSAGSSKDDVVSLIIKTQKAIENQRFDVALGNLEIMGDDYLGILVNVKNDLQNANNFKQISDDIYRYLEVLSNN